MKRSMPVPPFKIGPFEQEQMYKVQDYIALQTPFMAMLGKTTVFPRLQVQRVLRS